MVIDRKHQPKNAEWPICLKNNRPAPDPYVEAEMADKELKMFYREMIIPIFDGNILKHLIINHHIWQCSKEKDKKLNQFRENILRRLLRTQQNSTLSKIDVSPTFHEISQA